MKQEDSAERLLFLIKTEGAMAAKALAKKLDITTMGTRQHLAKLEEQGLVTTMEQKQARGRPLSLWILTQAGHARYADRHAQLTVELITTVQETFGHDGLQQVIARRTMDIQNSYLSAMDGLNTHERVYLLAKLRSEEGYMAKIEENSSGYLLIENHCPICAAAKSCQQFCQGELSIFQRCFQGLASVNRVEHILKNASRCAYQIQPLD